METSILFYLFGGDIFDPGQLAEWRAKKASAKRLPCSDVRVGKRTLVVLPLAGALWQLREDGAIRIDVTREGDPPGRLSRAGGLGRLVGSYDGYSPPQLPVLAVTLSPRAGEYASVERVATSILALNDGALDGRELAQRVVTELYYRYGWFGRMSAGLDGPLRWLRGQALDAGLFERHTTSGWLAKLDRRVDPDCSRIAALRPELESVKSRWESFCRDEAGLAAGVVETFDWALPEESSTNGGNGD